MQAWPNSGDGAVGKASDPSAGSVAPGVRALGAGRARLLRAHPSLPARGLGRSADPVRATRWARAPSSPEPSAGQVY